MSGRSAAAAAEDAYASASSFTREKSEIFRRRFGIDDTVAFALRETGVRHAADAEIVDRSELLQDRKKHLRPDGAVRSYDLNIFIFELGGCIGGSQVAIGGAVFGVGELRRNEWHR